MTKKIGIDLDEVLAELVDFILEKNDYKINGMKVKREDLTDYYIHNIKKFNIDFEYAVNWFRCWEDEDCNMNIVNGALKKLLEFQSKGYELKIITARLEENQGEYTKKWIKKYFSEINFSEIIFVNHFTENHRHKSEICIEHGINIMIEDNPHYAIELAEKGVKTYLLDKPWNKNYKKHKNIIKVKSWDEINE